MKKNYGLKVGDNCIHKGSGKKCKIVEINKPGALGWGFLTALVQYEDEKYPKWNTALSCLKKDIDAQ